MSVRSDQNGNIFVDIEGFRPCLRKLSYRAPKWALMVRLMQKERIKSPHKSPTIENQAFWVFFCHFSKTAILVILAVCGPDRRAMAAPATGAGIGARGRLLAPSASASKCCGAPFFAPFSRVFSKRTNRAVFTFSWRFQKFLPALRKGKPRGWQRPL